LLEQFLNCQCKSFIELASTREKEENKMHNYDYNEEQRDVHHALDQFSNGQIVMTVVNIEEVIVEFLVNDEIFK